MTTAEQNGERIAKLEEQMRGVRESGEERRRSEEGRRAFEDDVLQKLAVIIHQNAEFCDYRKEFEAITEAQGKRLNDVENENKTLRGQIKTLISYTKFIGCILTLAIAGVAAYKHG